MTATTNVYADFSPGGFAPLPADVVHASTTGGLGCEEPCFGAAMSAEALTARVAEEPARWWVFTWSEVLGEGVWARVSCAVAVPASADDAEVVFVIKAPGCDWRVRDSHTLWVASDSVVRREYEHARALLGRGGAR